MAKLKVAQFNEIPEGRIKRFKAGDFDLAIYKIGGRVYATSNLCTHENCFLNENNTIRGDVIECTCHGSQFDIKTGDVLIPPAVEALKTYKVTTEGEDVYIET